MSVCLPSIDISVFSQSGTLIAWWVSAQDSPDMQEVEEYKLGLKNGALERAKLIASLEEQAKKLAELEEERQEVAKLLPSVGLLERYHAKDLVGHARDLWPADTRPTKKSTFVARSRAPQLVSHVSSAKVFG